MIVGCYSLDLYCDNEKVHKDEYPGMKSIELQGRSRESCLRQARQVGWKINIQKWTCYCPQCKRKEG